MAPWYCSGNSELYKEEITQMIKEYDREVEPKFVHYIDNVLFSRAGLEKYSAEFTEQLMDHKSNTIKQIADTINSMSFDSMGDSISAIWCRPFSYEMYSKFVQIVGHTPVMAPTYKDNTWILDTFITDRYNKPFGIPTLTVFDTDSYLIEFYTNSELYCSYDRLHWKTYRKD